MEQVIFWFGVFGLSLWVLVKSSYHFTEAAEALAHFFQAPRFIVGVTIVSIGTSLPELASGIMATAQGSSEITTGAVFGSNITNILLVLGAAAIINRLLSVSWELVKVDLPILVGSAFLLALVALDGQINRYEAILCLLGYGFYFAYAFTTQKRPWLEFLRRRPEEKLNYQVLLTLIFAPVFIFLGAKYTIAAVVQLAEHLILSKEAIGAAVLALGTSLPELAVVASAAYKKRSEIVVGTVLGSNIFNSFAVVGFSGLLGVLVVPQSLIFFAMPMMLGATFLYFFITQDREISRWEGFILILLYAAFIGKLLSLF